MRRRLDENRTKDTKGQKLETENQSKSVQERQNRLS